MRRNLVAPLALLAALAAGGCSSRGTTLPPASAAPPQEVRVDWQEPTNANATSPRLVFAVTRLEIAHDGWQADVSIRNETKIPWLIGGSDATSVVPFGVMLFATGDQAELERRNRDRDLPGVRDALTARPPPPVVLDPGRSWEGTIAAPGALAAGRWLRVVFGPLLPQGDPPPDLPRRLVWITDNSYLLRG